MLHQRIRIVIIELNHFISKRSPGFMLHQRIKINIMVIIELNHFISKRRFMLHHRIRINIKVIIIMVIIHFISKRSPRFMLHQRIRINIMVIIQLNHFISIWLKITTRFFPFFLYIIIPLYLFFFVCEKQWQSWRNSGTFSVG